MIRIPRARWAVPFLALGVLAVAGCDDDDNTGPDQGTLRVVVTATGTPADPDGFDVLIDDVDVGNIPAAGGTLADRVLDPDDYEVELGGVASNCTVAGDNPRTVTITDGDLTTTTFAVTCAAATTGTVTINTTTAGDNPDANGFQVSVGGAAAQAIAATGTLDVTNVAIGDAPVLLTDVAGNCAVTEDNPTILTVTAAGPNTATFTVDCDLNEGSAAVAFATTGANLDADGFDLTVDGGTAIPVANVNGIITVSDLAPGDHDFVIGGVAANCTVTGGNTQTITIADAAVADVDFAVVCT
jgi:hypothetical protein